MSFFHVDATRQMVITKIGNRISKTILHLLDHLVISHSHHEVYRLLLRLGTYLPGHVPGQLLVPRDHVDFL